MLILVFGPPDPFVVAPMLMALLVFCLECAPSARDTGL